MLRNMMWIIGGFWLVVSLAHGAETAKGKISGGVAHDMPDWFTDSFMEIPDDVAEAGEEGKLVMLFFHLANCPYCDAVLNENFRGGENTDFIQQHFSVIAVNVKGGRDIILDENTQMTEQEITEQLQVRYTPTVLFLNREGKVVYRTNGYRSPQAFAQVLRFVQQGAYNKMNLATYVQQQGHKPSYDFMDHPRLEQVGYFKGVTQPVAVMFEDNHCTDCADWHQNVLNHEDVLAELKPYLFVRLDAQSNDKIIDFNGKSTTAKQWVADLGLDYRPGIVLFDGGKEIQRVDGQLYHFHFKEILRYVSGKHYQTFPTFLDYLRPRQQALLDSGVNIDLAK